MRKFNLHDLLKLVDIYPSKSLANPQIKNISFNSKDIIKGTLFLGLPGKKNDGGVFWEEALNNGAVAAIISEEAMQITGRINKDKVIVLKKPLEKIYGDIISEFWNKPSRRLKLIGVTGTNGKTTVTFLLEYLLKNLDKKVALFGTLFNRWQGYSEISNYTTDFADSLQPKLNAACEAGSEFAIMEVSSHAIDQKRIAGCEFNCAVFTNLSQDHLDYHEDMKGYFQTKMKLFKLPYLSPENCFSVINFDDLWGKKLINNIQTKHLMISTQMKGKNLNSDNFLYVSNIKFSSKGIYCLLHTSSEVVELSIPLVGEFNLMNALQAIGVLYELRFPLGDICNAIKTFPGVPGRMEQIIIEKDIANKLPTVIVDYAHTPDGLEKVLKVIQNISMGKIITVFGCGGDRDTKKRPLMGSISERFSDFTLITSDNPRTENPQKIIKDIVSGIKNKDNIAIEVNRHDAIRKAINLARINDFVLIAGKGHEDYQILKDETVYFDDRKIANKILLDKFKRLD